MNLGAGALIEAWLRQDFLGQPAGAWLAAAGIATAAILFVALAKRWTVRRMAGVAARTASPLDDLVVDFARRTRIALLVPLALDVGSLALSLPPRADRILRSAAVLGLLLQVAIWASAAIDAWVNRSRQRRLPTDAAAATTLGVLRFIGKLALWSLLLLLALDNVGVDVTALVAGLGIGGIAVALALQNILGDLFASLSIVIDKPFVLGDSIAVGDFAGTVESIGLKTTRLRSVSGEQIVFANGDLLQSRLRNYRRMAERRVVLTFGVSSQTPPADLERIPGLVRGAVEAQSPVRFERAHLRGLGAFLGVLAVEFEVVYWVLSPDVAVHMDVQQEVHLALLRGLAEEKIALAQPAPSHVVHAALADQPAEDRTRPP